MIWSLTKYLKKERKVEIFLAMELFLFFRWRKLKYLRISIRFTFSISVSPAGERHSPELCKNILKLVSYNILPYFINKIIRSKRSPSLRRGHKSLGLTPPQPGLPKTFESGWIHASN